MERNIPRDMTSTEIFEFVLTELEDLQRREYKRRFLDLSTLIVVGQFIDWSTLVKQLNSYTYPEFRRKYLKS